MVVDKLTKSINLFNQLSTFKVAKIAEVYMKEIARLHGIPKAIVLDCDPNFTSNFWKGFSRNLVLN